MSCPTCDHTMEQVVEDIFWCPRCGTLRDVQDIQRGTDATPKLVERCREYEKLCIPHTLHAFHDAGISESINLPANRPEVKP
jgi:tRNA(Ile2) C34 agmatinyltransferase TiaS